MKIPDELFAKAQDPRVKVALLLEYKADPDGCSNCGGMGFISMFLATNGPFDGPGSGKQVSKYHNGKWWCAPSGSMEFGTISATCPVCAGIKDIGRNAVYVPGPQFRRLTEGMQK